MWASRKEMNSSMTDHSLRKSRKEADRGGEAPAFPHNEAISPVLTIDRLMKITK